MSLNAKQRKFVNEYAKSGNATQAAIAAKYSKKTAYSTGPRLLDNVEIRQAIDTLLTKATEKAELTVAEVLAEMRNVAFFDIAQAFNTDGSLKEIGEMDEKTRRIISSLETDEIFAGRGGARKKIGVTRKLKLADKMKALEMIGRHFKMFTDVTEVSGPNGGPQVVLTMPADGSEAPAQPPKPQSDNKQ